MYIQKHNSNENIADYMIAGDCKDFVALSLDIMMM